MFGGDHSEILVEGVSTFKNYFNQYSRNWIASLTIFPMNGNIHAVSYFDVILVCCSIGVGCPPSSSLTGMKTFAVVGDPVVVVCQVGLDTHALLRYTQKAVCNIGIIYVNISLAGCLGRCGRITYLSLFLFSTTKTTVT